MSKLYAAKTSGWWELRHLIKHGHEFHNNGKTFRGVHRDAESARLPARGWMPESDYHRMAMMQDMHGIDYVVFSYGTVIAYRLTNGVWVTPSAKYSRTTTAHQHKINVVASQLMEEMESAK